MKKHYIPRILDGELLTRMESAGAVLLEGPKACGKTETAKQLAASEVYLDVDAGARALLDTSPRRCLVNRLPSYSTSGKRRPNCGTFCDEKSIKDHRSGGNLF